MRTGTICLATALWAAAGWTAEPCGPPATEKCPPIKLARQPCAPAPRPVPVACRPAPKLQRVEQELPRWKEAAAPPPVQLAPAPPPPTPCLKPAPHGMVRLLTKETAPPIWTELPGRPPIRLLQITADAPKEVPPRCLPSVTLAPKPVGPAPVCKDACPKPGTPE